MSSHLVLQLAVRISETCGGLLNIVDRLKADMSSCKEETDSIDYIALLYLAECLFETVGMYDNSFPAHGA